MSASVGIGSFKSKADKERKESDYRKYLRLQARLNKQAEQVVNIPIPLPETTIITQEVERDLNKTRESILNALRPYLGQSGALRFIYRYISSPADLDTFSTNMAEFLPYVRVDPARPLTPAYLFSIYSRWLQRKRAREDKQNATAPLSGGGYGTLDPTLQTEVDRMGHEAHRRVLNSVFSPSQMLKYSMATEEAMKQHDLDTLAKIAGGCLC